MEPAQFHSSTPSASSQESSTIQEVQSQPNTHSPANQNTPMEAEVDKLVKPQEQLGIGEENADDGDKNKSVDDLYLGHIAEAHYLSLRHHDWEPRLYECLKTKKTSCFLHYGRTTATSKDENSDSNEDDFSQTWNVGRVSFPPSHLDFFMKFFRRTKPTLKITGNLFKDTENVYGVYTYVGDYINGLDVVFSGLKSNTSRKSGNTGKMSYTVTGGWFVTPADTKVVSSNFSSNANQKDLVSDESGCSIGCTQLCPVDPSIWLHYAITENGNQFIKHVHFVDNQPGLIAFKCDWPKCADEWITRERLCNWPMAVIRDSVKKDGVRVIAKRDVGSSDQNTEWQFSFDIGEKILSRTSLTPAVRFCFQIFKVILNFIFQEKTLITSEHLNSIFFYTCEEVPRDKFVNEPGQCILLMLLRLRRHLEGNFLPDYFIKDKNLIGHIAPDDLFWHLEKIQVFEDHIIEHLFVLFDQNDLMAYLGLGTCLDTVLIDAQKFSVHRRMALTYAECFHPLYVFQIQEKVKNADYQRAKLFSDRAFTELSRYMYQDSSDATTFMKDVLRGLLLQEQWLFAFYLDALGGYDILKYVCSQHDCVSLQTIFGQRFVNAMAADGTVPVHTLDIPTAVAYQINLVNFARQFGTLLMDYIGNEDAYLAATHHFLKQNTHELLLTIARERIEGVNYSSQLVTISNLEKMFTDVYNLYQELNQTHEFKDLMELYNELCDYLDTANNYQFLVKLWHYFGDSAKAELAKMKAVSLQRDESGSDINQSTSV